MSTKNAIKTSIILQQRTIVTALAGVGKTTFCLSEFRDKNRKLTEQSKSSLFIFIDADDKSLKQKQKFKQFMEDKLKGYYFNFYTDLNSKKTKATSFLEYVIHIGKNVVKSKVNKYDEVFILIDNLSKLIGEFENENAIVTNVINELQSAFMKHEKINTTIIAHSGKNQKDPTGVRGASTIVSEFGEVIQLRKDYQGTVTATVIKDNENLHKVTNHYETVPIDLDNYIIEYKILQKGDIVENEMAYKKKRLKNIVLSVVNYLKENDFKIVQATKFESAIYSMCEGEDELHSDDLNYISAIDAKNWLRTLLPTLELVYTKEKGSNKAYLYLTDENNTVNMLLATKKNKLLSLGDMAKEILKVGRVETNVKSLKTGQKESLKKAIIDLFDNTVSLTATDIRSKLNTYIEQQNEYTFTKYFMKHNLPGALEEMVEDNVLLVTIDGRKKIYSLKEK